MRVFINAIFVQIFLTAYVFYRGWQLLPKNKPIRIGYLSIFLFELLIYFVAFFAAESLPDKLLHWMVWIGTSWMIFICYFGGLLLAFDLLRFINRKTKLFARFNHLNPLKVKRIVFVGCLTFVLAIMSYGNHSFRHPQVNEYSLHINKKAGNIKTMKVVVASDIHAGYLINKELLSKYVDLIMAQKPDLILLPGDIIDYNMKPIEEQAMEEEFKRLKAPYGVFGCPGNHDYIHSDDEEEFEKLTWLETKSGITLLRDSAVLIDSSFYVIGREDYLYEKRIENLKNITDKLDKKLPLFVLAHQPHELDDDEAGGADFATYGHTHNGQVFPANLLVKSMYEIAHGYKKKGNMHAYVSSGLGLAGPQYRIGTVSEIVVFTITFD